MSEPGRRVALFRIAPLALALSASPSLADEGARERGMQLAREGRCDAALADLDTARAAAPDDVALLELTGLCELRLHRYSEAASALEAALRVAPQRADLSLALAMARFHAGDLDGAEQALAGAGALESDAEYQLYLGMLRLERRDFVGAATALARARELDAKRVEPVASYYLGLAEARIREEDRARQTLSSVRDAWAGTVWGDEAARALARLERGETRSAFGSLGAGFEYDDNAVLRGRGVPLPSDISGKSDWAGLWNATAGLELWKHDDTTLGLMGSYRGTTYVDLTDFDVHFPGATIWLEGPVGESSRGRLRYDFGYAWEGGDPFFATNAVQASLEHPWPRYGTTAAYVQGFYDAYFFNSQNVPNGPGAPGSACADSTRPCGPSNLNERNARERDGVGWAAGFDHTLPVATESLPLRDTSLVAGFRYAGFESAGREYDFDALDFHGGFATIVPAALALDVLAGFTFRPYRHSSTYPDPSDVVDGEQYALSNSRKREETTHVEVGLSRSFAPSLTIGAHFRYLDNESTVQVFDYDQYVVGMTVTWTFQREL
ncbi:MAG TPA: tetratricopeptide repeat protein [Myxococcota bacterium]|nr:tetratricopeptide repeat protein [Myxococcota bacterium]